MKLLRVIANGGTAVLIVTHEVDTLSYGDKTYSMNNGTMIDNTTTGVLL